MAFFFDADAGFDEYVERRQRQAEMDASYEECFPSFIDQAEEDREYEANARYDYIREAFWGEVETAEQLEAERRWEIAEERIAHQDATEARGGPDPEVWRFRDDEDLPF